MSRPRARSSAGEARVPTARDGGAHATLLQQLLDQLLIGVILVDAQARPSFVNRQGRDLLARHDGLIDGSAGLKAATAADTRRLRHAVALMAASADIDDAPALARYLGLPRRSRRAAPLLLRLSPLPGPPPEVVVLVTTPEHLRPVPPEALAAAFGLTPREAALAGMLADGHELRDCARLLAMGEGTARNHLKHVFEKTVKHSQATLVAALCRMAAPCR